jgi:cysteine desulfurase
MEIIYLPVDDQGQVSVPGVAAAIKANTILITIMHANNEVGTIQPIAEIAQIAKESGILLHTDAAQSIGKIPATVDNLGVDLLSIAGHKVYAPKGVGALFVRDGVKLANLMYDAGQEPSLRPGTENVLKIVGLGKACEIAKRDLDINMTHMHHMRDRLYEGIKIECTQVRLNGHPQKRLPNTLNLSFRDLEANRILDKISHRVAASAGAACHSGRVLVSQVLKAMGVPLNWAKGTLKLTTGRRTTEEDIDTAVQVICEVVNTLKN